MHFQIFLQQQTPPRYLTGTMKAYIKEMIKQNKTNEDIFEYLVGLRERLPYGVLDPVTRKITQKGYNAVPPPKGINPISPKPRTPKNNSSNKKPV